MRYARTSAKKEDACKIVIDLISKLKQKEKKKKGYRVGFRKNERGSSMNEELHKKKTNAKTSVQRIFGEQVLLFFSFFKDRHRQHQRHTKPVEVEQKDPWSPPPTFQKQKD